MRRKDKKRVKFSLIYAIMIAACLALPLFSACSNADGSGDGNKFYNKHYESLVLCGRSFTPAASSAVLTKPDGREVAKLPAGEAICVERYYTDGGGEVWGYVKSPAEGWVAMAGLELVYDHIAFVEAHPDEISDTGGSLPPGKKYLWSYPCSGVIIGTDYSDPDYEEHPDLTMLYIDRKGREWGCLDIGGWVCLDAPDDDGIAAVDYGSAVMTYYRPPEEPGYWDTAPPYAPYVWGGVALIILVEAAIQVRAYIKRGKV